MERIFETKLVLKKGTSISKFYKEVAEYHYGIGWSLCVQSGFEKGVYITIYCQENVAKRFKADYLVVFDAEISMQLGTEIIPITTKTKVTKKYFDTILDKNLREQLEAHIVRSDAIFNFTVKILKTFGCRCDTLMKFDQPKAFWTDQCLHVGEKKFHVNKKFLAHKSEIFKELFRDSLYKKLSSCWKSSNDITIDDTDPDAFENFLLIVHKKSPAFPVELVPQIIELAKRFKVGSAKEYCEWYLFQYIEAKLEYDPSDRKNMDRILKQVFPTYEPITDIHSWWQMTWRLNELYLSTMEDNYRKPEKFVISLEMVEFCKGCSKEKKIDYFGLSWTTSIRSRSVGSSCYLKCDELYRMDRENPNDGPDIPGWCVVVNVKVFAWFEEKKIMVGSKYNGVYHHVLEDVEVELSKENDWNSMSAGDVRFEIDVEIVKAAAIRHWSLEDFTKEKKGWTDVVLVAGERHFHVNKKTLAQSSEVFADTFKTHGSVARQLQLNENDPEAFHMFLQLSHGASTFIKDKEIPGMITMARKYKSKTVLDACTESILHYSHELFPNNVVESLNQLNCPLTWETLVQDGEALSSIDAKSVSDVGLNIMFRRLVALKIKKQNRGCMSPTAEKCPDSMLIPLSGITNEEQLTQCVESYNTFPRPVKLALYHIAKEWEDFCNMR